MGNMNWGHMGGGAGWGWVFLAILLIGVAVLAVVLVRVLAGRGGPTPDGGGRSQARQILDERYARGEIDVEEYDERRRRLNDGDGG